MTRLNKILKKFVEYGLYIFIFLLPIQTRYIIRAGEINGGYLEYLTLSLYAIDIILILIFSAFIFLKFKKFFKLEKSNIGLEWYFLAGLELCFFISIFFSADKLIALERYIWLIFGLMIFILIRYADYSRAKFFYSLIAGAVVQVGLGIYQFLFQASFSSKFLGMASHSAGVLGDSVVGVALQNGLAGRWLRAYGSLDHPNMLGGFLAIILLIIFSLLINKNKTRLKNKNNLIKYYLLLFIYFIVFLGLFFSFSRSAYLAVFLGLLIIIIKIFLSRDKLLILTASKLLFFLLILSGIFFSIFSSLIITRASIATPLEKKSVNERISALQESGEVLKENWLFGAGAGNYALSLETAREKSTGQNVADLASWTFQPVHNSFILAWAEIGIFGFGFFILFYIYTCYHALFKINKKNRAVALAIISALFVMMMLDHFWWSLHFGILFSFFIVAMIWSMRIESND